VSAGCKSEKEWVKKDGKSWCDYRDWNREDNYTFIHNSHVADLLVNSTAMESSEGIEKT
jgi:hypothetical protein